MKPVKYTSINKKISRDVRIAILGDTHLDYKTSSIKIKNILAEIEDINPDFIIHLGDIVEDGNNIPDVFYMLFEGLNNIVPKKVYAIPGNHDMITANGLEYTSPFEDFPWVKKDISQLIKLLNDMDINTLYNSSEYLEDLNINLIGLSLDASHYEPNISKGPRESKKDFLKKTKSYYPKAFSTKVCNILLSHSPINISKEEVVYKLKLMRSISIVLAAHMHNGGVPYWFEPLYNYLAALGGFEYRKNRGIIAPGGELFPEISRGSLEVGDIKYYICPPITTLAEENSKLSKIINSNIGVSPRVMQLTLKKN